MTDPTDPTDPAAPIRDLAELARKVGNCANILARAVSDQADPERAAAILDTLAACIAIQAKRASEEIGISVDTAISIVASSLGFLAKRAGMIEMPTDPAHIH